MRSLQPLVCLLFFYSIGSAQQYPLFANFQDNNFMVNAAMPQYDYLLEQSSASFGIVYRKQWSQLSNGPKTFVARAEGFLDLNHGTSVAIRNIFLSAAIIGDRAGMLKIDGYYLRAGFSLGFEDSVIRGGVSYIKNNIIFFADPKLLSMNNPIAGSQFTRSAPGFNVGVIYEWHRDNHRLIGGYSANPITNLLSTSFPNQLDLEVHHYGILGWVYQDEEEIYRHQFEVFMWLKYLKNVPFHTDLSVRYGLNLGNDHCIQLGMGTTFDSVAGKVSINGLYFMPNIVFNYNENFLLKIGFAFQAMQRNVIKDFGNIWEYKLDGSFL